MQTATSETESKSRDLSICVHHYTLRAPCPKGQGNSKAIAAFHRARVGRGGGGGGDSNRRPTRCVGHNQVNCALQHPGAIVPWQRGRREATERGGAPVG